MVPVINGCIPIINCNADLILSISANVTRSRIFRLERSGGCARYVARAFRSIVSPSRTLAIVYVTTRSPIAELIGNRVVTRYRGHLRNCELAKLHVSPNECDTFLTFYCAVGNLVGRLATAFRSFPLLFSYHETVCSVWNRTRPAGCGFIGFN